MALRETVGAEAAVELLYTRPPSPDEEHPALTAGVRVRLRPAARCSGNCLIPAPAALPECAELDVAQLDALAGA